MKKHVFLSLILLAVGMVLILGPVHAAETVKVGVVGPRRDRRRGRNRQGL